MGRSRHCRYLCLTGLGCIHQGYVRPRVGGRDHGRSVELLETTPDRLPDRLRRMEAVFISLMALVVLGTGWVALVVLYHLFKAGA